MDVIKGVSIRYVNVIKDIYNDEVTSVGNTGDNTNKFSSQ